MEIYAPLAHRLGISSIKWELEDLSFYYLEPRKFHRVQKMVAESRDAREAYLQQVIDQLTGELDAIDVEADISGRPKHLYSIYQKMSQKGKDFNEIYDLIALRVIVDSVKDCYGALGTVHSIWKPVPGRFKDYVAMPKFNMYQSLHTTVIGPAGRPLEIQIRSEEMHRTAEYGIAAHWRYKEGGTRRRLVRRAPRVAAPDARMADRAQGPPRVHGGAQDRPLRGRGLRLHSQGRCRAACDGARRRSISPTRSTPRSAITVWARRSTAPSSLSATSSRWATGSTSSPTRAASPSRDWLNIVKTSSARSKIRSYFSKVSREDDLQSGKEELGKVMRKHGLGLSSSATQRALDAVAEEMNYHSSDDLMAQIGVGQGVGQAGRRQAR